MKTFIHFSSTPLSPVASSSHLEAPLELFLPQESGLELRMSFYEISILNLTEFLRSWRTKSWKLYDFWTHHFSLSSASFFRGRPSPCSLTSIDKFQAERAFRRMCLSELWLFYSSLLEDTKFAVERWLLITWHDISFRKPQLAHIIVWHWSREASLSRHPEHWGRNRLLLLISHIYSRWIFEEVHFYFIKI